MESSVEDLQNVEIEITCNPAVLFSGVYSKESQPAAWRGDTCTSIFIAALFTIAKIGKQTRSPSTGLEHIYNEVLLRRKE